MGTLLGRWVPRENSFFRETLGESGRVGPRIGVFGHPAALRCQRQGPSDGARPHGCCRGTMWVPYWVGGYPGKTRFLGRLGRKWPGGTQNRCFWASGSASLPETGAKRRGATPWVL